MKKIIAIILILAMLICVFVSCGDTNTITSTTTEISVNATTGQNTVIVPIKIVEKSEYSVLEVYGYDIQRKGNYSNDILLKDVLYTENIDIIFDENGEIEAETLELISKMYNVDMSGFAYANVNNALESHCGYIHEEFFKSERAAVEISFLEIETGKFAIQYKMDFHIFKTEDENWVSDFRHLIIYLN